MPSVLAIVSKAVFEKAATGGVGAVWPTTSYASRHRSLDALADGGALFLVTVRPPDERLWLVAILDAPRADRAGWRAAKNTTAIRDITDIAAKLAFATGAGLKAKPGTLGMSLQTPRVLSAADVVLLRGTRAKASPAVAKPAGKPPRQRPRAERSTAATVAGGDLEAAIAGGAWAEAVPQLLALWRTTREPKLGDVLEAIAARTTPAAPPPSEGVAAQQAAWLRWAKGLPVVDVPAALASLDAARVKSKPALARLAVLDRRDPDPRIGRFLVGLLANPPFQSTGTQPFWKRVLDALQIHHDARILAMLDALAGGGVRRVGARTMGEWFDKRIAELLAVVRDRAAGARPDGALAARCDVWLASLARPAPENRRDALLAAVYARPDDDGPRAVLADYLQEQGDPQGELIALQLAETGAARVAELLKKHAKRFLGPLAKVLDAVRFERGFPAAGRFEPRTGGELRRAIGEPAWATIRALHVGYFPYYQVAEVAGRHELVSSPALRHLAELWVSADVVIQFAALGGPFPWRTLAIDAPRFGDWGDTDPADGKWHARPAALGDALTRATFPALEHLLLVLERPDADAATGLVALIEQAPWLATLRLTVNFALPVAAAKALRALGATRVTSTPGVTDPFED